MLALGDMLSEHSTAQPLQPKTRIRSARSRNRAAACAYDLAQWREYQILSHPSRREEIEAEYARLATAGPDFTRYHSGSAFVEAPLHTISRDDRIRMLQAFDHVRAGLYHHGRPPRGQAISRLYRDVLGVLLSFAVKHGRVYPSLATIARAAMCSVRTVQRAVAWLELFGFVGRVRRLARMRTPLGSVKVQQASNAYRLTTRLAGLGAMALNVFSGRGGHKCQASIEKGSAGKKTKPNADCSFDQFSRFEPQGRP